MRELEKKMFYFVNDNTYNPNKLLFNFSDAKIFMVVPFSTMGTEFMGSNRRVHDMKDIFIAGLGTWQNNISNFASKFEGGFCYILEITGDDVLVHYETIQKNDIIFLTPNHMDIINTFDNTINSMYPKLMERQDHLFHQKLQVTYKNEEITINKKSNFNEKLTTIVHKLSYVLGICTAYYLCKNVDNFTVYFKLYQIVTEDLGIYQFKPCSIQDNDSLTANITKQTEFEYFKNNLLLSSIPFKNRQIGGILQELYFRGWANNELVDIDTLKQFFSKSVQFFANDNSDRLINFFGYSKDLMNYIDRHEDLSQSIRFYNYGLLIIDEDIHFAHTDEHKHLNKWYDVSIYRITCNELDVNFLGYHNNELPNGYFEIDEGKLITIDLKDEKIDHNILKGFSLPKPEVLTNLFVYRKELFEEVEEKEPLLELTKYFLLSEECYYGRAKSLVFNKNLLDKCDIIAQKYSNSLYKQSSNHFKELPIYSSSKSLLNIFEGLKFDEQKITKVTELLSYPDIQDFRLNYEKLNLGLNTETMTVESNKRKLEAFFELFTLLKYVETKKNILKLIKDYEISLERIDWDFFVADTFAIDQALQKTANSKRNTLTGYSERKANEVKLLNSLGRNMKVTKIRGLLFDSANRYVRMLLMKQKSIEKKHYLQKERKDFKLIAMKFHGLSESKKEIVEMAFTIPIEQEVQKFSKGGLFLLVSLKQFISQLDRSNDLIKLGLLTTISGISSQVIIFQTCTNFSRPEFFNDLETDNISYVVPIQCMSQVAYRNFRNFHAHLQTDAETNKGIRNFKWCGLPPSNISSNKYLNMDNDFLTNKIWRRDKPDGQNTYEQLTNTQKFVLIKLILTFSNLINFLNTKTLNIKFLTSILCPAGSGKSRLLGMTMGYLLKEKTIDFLCLGPNYKSIEASVKNIFDNVESTVNYILFYHEVNENRRIVNYSKSKKKNPKKFDSDCSFLLDLCLGVEKNIHDMIEEHFASDVTICWKHTNLPPKQFPYMHIVSSYQDRVIELLISKMNYKHCNDPFNDFEEVFIFKRNISNNVIIKILHKYVDENIIKDFEDLIKILLVLGMKTEFDEIFKQIRVLVENIENISNVFHLSTRERMRIVMAHEYIIDKLNDLVSQRTMDTKRNIVKIFCSTIDSFTGNITRSIILMDESSKSSFCNDLALLCCFDRPCVCVFTGDTTQLKPNVGIFIESRLFTECLVKHFEISGLELLSKLLLPSQQFAFIDNFRSHEIITRFNSALFYGNLLKPGTPLDLLPKKIDNDYPLQFFNIGCSCGTNIKPKRGDSSYRLVECYFAVKLAYESIVKNCSWKWELERLPENAFTSHIGIIVPYREQANQIREILLNVAARNPNGFDPEITRYMDKIKVETVDSFQGAEASMIIYSFTRSSNPFSDNFHSVGFLKNFHRMCVAFTRAKSKFVFIGDFDTFQRVPAFELFFNGRECTNGSITGKSVFNVMKSHGKMFNVEPHEQDIKLLFDSQSEIYLDEEDEKDENFIEESDYKDHFDEFEMKNKSNTF
eukprot:TRINITY_DN3279_c9_g1_i1.p1 TRINITY_DN3279_c9_g1~~TRINITY_DN3279_c9_g1_i1.p1  ORF type:complete len:1522 (-),score=389.57 TRINITY_DN3279_c9_g1_i1:744-5309(-)